MGKKDTRIFLLLDYDLEKDVFFFKAERYSDISGAFVLAFWYG